METQRCVEARGLKKAYGSRVVVQGVDLAVAPGEVVAVIGPNGAGKTTTLEMVLGLRRPDAGTVAWWVPDPRAQVGVQLQNTPFFPGLTTRENLRTVAALYGRTLSRGQQDALLSRCGLGDVANLDAARLSGGQQKRLAIALALTHAPRLVMLDEPSAALDPRAASEVRALLRNLAQEGVAVVFTSHDMTEVARVADRVILVAGGRVVANGAPAALLHRTGAPDLDALYLRLTATPDAA